MPIGGLSQPQTIAFIAETNSAKNLLAYGVRVIRTGAFFETTRDPIFTMLSIGLEKLHKLALGLLDLDRDGTWPSKAVMVGHGHGLSAMHAELIPALRLRAEGNSPYARDLVLEAEADPVMSPVVAALDSYGQSGRYYYLDLLGEAPQKWDDPRAYWHEIELAAMDDPSIASASSTATGAVSDNALWDRFHRLLRERIATAVERLWIAIAVCGRHGVLGEAGKTFGFEVHPDAVGRQIKSFGQPPEHTA